MSPYLDCDVNVAAGSIIEQKKSQNFGGDCHDNSMLFSSTPFLGDVNNMVHASVVYLGFCAPPHPPHKKKIKLKGDYDSMVMLHISCCQVIKNLNKIREI
jgi:hypothetical protein